MVRHDLRMLATTAHTSSEPDSSYSIIDEGGAELDGTGRSAEETYFKYMGKEFLLRQPSGRVFSYDIQNDELKVIMDGLYFPNGIVTDPAKQSIIVSELNKYRLLRHYVSGSKKGKTEILLDNIFGFPDNLKWDEQGNLLLGVPAIRENFL